MWYEESDASMRASLSPSYPPGLGLLLPVSASKITCPQPRVVTQSARRRQVWEATYKDLEGAKDLDGKAQALMEVKVVMLDVESDAQAGPAHQPAHCLQAPPSPFMPAAALADDAMEMVM